MLDEGSSITLIDEATTSSIGLDGPQRPLHVQGIQNVQLGEASSKKVSLIIKGEFGQYDLQNINTIKNLSLPIQTIEQNLISKCSHFRDINLKPMNKAQPSILIGQDNWHLITTRELRGSQQKLPAASRTLLGWVIHGPINSKNYLNSSFSCLLNQNNHTTRDEPTESMEKVDELFKDYFSIDSLGVLAINKNNKGEERANRILKSTSRRVGDSWETGLLWKNDNVEKSDGKIVAQNRLKSLERKLDSNPQYALEYCQQMERMISLYAKPAPSDSKGKRIWYIPHFGIKNPNKPEKKVRIGFDAAAKSNGTSYND